MGFLDFFSGDKVSDKSISDLITETPKNGSAPTSSAAVPPDSTPSKPVASDLQSLADRGLLPQKGVAPKAWDQMLSGSLDVNEVQEKYKNISVKKAPFAKSVSVTTPDGQSITQDSILADYAKKGLIPTQEQAPKTWAQIKDGTLKLNEVQDKFKNIQVGPMDASGNEIKTEAHPAPETIVSPDSLKKEPFTSSTIYVPATGDFETISDDPEFNAGKNASNQQFLHGATFGGTQAPDISQHPELKATAHLMDLAGGLFSGSLGGEFVAGGLRAIPAFRKVEQTAQVLGDSIQELKNTKTVAKAIGTAEEYGTAAKELLKAQLKKAGVNLFKTGVESATLGAGVGAVKSTIQGNSWRNVLADSLNESAWFTAFGTALQPIMGGAAKAIGARQQGRIASTLTSIAKEPELQALAKEGLNPNFISRIKDGVSGELSSGETLAKQALDKIGALNPNIGMDVKLLSHPELLTENTNFNARTISNSLFGKGGSLENLPKQNPQLQLLIDTGKHVEALDSVQAVMTNVLADNPTVKDYSLAPFANNSKSLNKVLTDRVMDTVKNPERFPELSKNVFNYLNEPTAENALLVSGKQAPRQFLSKVQGVGPKYADSRLNPKEIDSIVFDSFKDMMGKIAGDTGANIPQGLFGKLKNDEGILKTAVTFNKELNRRFIQGYAQNPYGIDSYFLKAKPELADGIDAHVNMVRLQREQQVALDTRRELSVATADLETQMRAASSPDVKQELQFKLNTLKDQSQSLAQTLSAHTKDIREISNKMQGYSPEQTQEIREFVNQVYIPNRGGNTFKAELDRKMAANVAAKKEGLGELGQAIAGSETSIVNKYAGGKIENAGEFKGRFGDKENPYYLAADSELADVMHAFQTTGKDISESVGKKFTFPFGLNIKNLRRQMQGEFGPNNFFEKILNRAQDSSAAVEEHVARFSNFVDELGIKPKSNESAWLQKIGEKRALPTDPEFLKLKPDAQSRVMDAVPQVRKYYDDFIDVLNAKMRSNNLPEIAKRDNFLTHFGQVSQGLPAMMQKLVSGAEDVIDFSKGGKLGFWKNEGFDATRTFFRSEKARKGGEFVDDAITGMKLYMRPALERIHFADMIRQIDTAKQFAPQNLSKFLQDFKDKYLLRANDSLDAEASKGLTKFFGAFTNRLGKGAILGNANVLLQQATSIPTNFAAGGMHGAKALGQLFHEDGERIASLSKNLRVRDTLHVEVDRTEDLIKNTFLNNSKVVGKVKDAGEFYNHFLEGAMSTFDRMAAKHAFLTGYSRAQQAGLSGEGAVHFADKFVEMVQANPTRLGQPEFYQSKTLKPLVQFTSFVNNLAGTILSDLPTIARTEGSSEAVGMLIKTYAGMTITNEASRKAGLPIPFDLYKMIPFLNNYRFGVQGPFGVGMKGAEYVIAKAKGNERDAKSAENSMIRSGISLLGPGGGQAGKMLDVLQRKKNREYGGSRKDQFVKDLVFGHTNPEEMKPVEDRRSFPYKTKKFFRKFVNENT